MLARSLYAPHSGNAVRAILTCLEDLFDPHDLAVAHGDLHHLATDEVLEALTQPGPELVCSCTTRLGSPATGASQWSGDVDYVSGSVALRMLRREELFRAQGFPADYIIDRTADGRPLSISRSVKMVGNSVSPPPLLALARANLYQVEVTERVAA